ncbi:MAG TPA: maleylacetoacetate isomerase [Beijerinckiaceae bacterium]|nr:maleylacetoacetate isomerase [Beijerinckiaceae bacterium]
MKLFDYFRSGAAYRVRIALNLKGIPVDHASVHLRRGEQRGEAYLRLNPQGLVPALVTDGGDVLTQSLAIIHWLEARYPEPSLLPQEPLQRARVEAFVYAIVCDTHPVQNLKVLNKLRAMGHSEDEVTGWAAWVNAEGLGACEKLVAAQPGPFCFGDQPSLADVCLVPQLGNARRFKVDVSAFPRLLQAEAAAKAHPAFQAAAPEQQADFEA